MHSFSYNGDGVFSVIILYMGYTAPKLWGILVCISRTVEEPKSLYTSPFCKTYLSGKSLHRVYLSPINLLYNSMLGNISCQLDISVMGYNWLGLPPSSSIFPNWVCLVTYVQACSKEILCWYIYLSDMSSTLSCLGIPSMFNRFVPIVKNYIILCA